MKISKRVREEAAVLCAIAASTFWECMPRHDDASLDENEWEQGDWFQSGSPDEDTEAGKLAIATSQFARSYEHGVDEAWAEAEALLRCGWSPGDEP